ncbi:MAG: L-serine ammonia-lyase, iron-sulfur-dependent, subunit alpha [Bradymonadales bacterium]
MFLDVFEMVVKLNEIRITYDDSKLNPNRRRIFRLLTPILRTEGEDVKLAEFLQKMPWNYAREVNPEIIASHWKILRNIDLSVHQSNMDEYTMRHDHVEAWIGPLNFMRLPAAMRALKNNEESPLERVFVHDDGHVAVMLSYAKALDGLEFKLPNPPSWVGTIKSLQAISRKGRSSISFDAVVLENSTLLRIEVLNSSQSIVFRKICEIVAMHRIIPASIDIWSAYEHAVSRRIKERHNIEIEIRSSLEDDIIQSIKDDAYRYLLAQLKVHSLFDIIGPAMIGPSSSHTAGACRIGQLARSILMALQDAKHFKVIHDIEIVLYGSFRNTGPGHGTHIALGAGIKGLSPDSPLLREQGQLSSLEHDGIPWREGGKVVFLGFRAATEQEDRKFINKHGDCSNIAEIIASTDKGEFSIVGFSTGGSLVEVRHINNLMLAKAITGKRDLWLPPPPLGERIGISQNEIEKGGCIAKIYPQRPPRNDIEPMFNTFDEVLELAKEKEKTLLELAIEIEMELQGSTAEQIHKNMFELWLIMQQSVEEGLGSQTRTTMNLSGGDGQKFLAYLKKQGFVSFHSLAAAYALASAETNAQMGRIVACPTGGACGIIPGVMRAWYELNLGEGRDPVVLENMVVEALLVAAFIGMIFYDDIPTAGATLGCQAEIGIGAAMAAAALVQLNGGSAEEVVHGAILTIKNCMGLVCDPVAGLVEVPCIKRNALYASFSITGADMARSGIRSQIPPDQVVLAVKEVGERMHPDYKESAKGGLAATLNGKDIARRFSDLCEGLFCGSGLCR